MAAKEQEVLYPRFISNKPCGKDSFKNKPHESVAETITQLIRNSDVRGIKNPIIGLDGDWGSGKSNTIHILEDKLKNEKEKYYVFTYDVWSHQEDLTRLSFLEELIEWALKNNISLKNKCTWEDKDKKLSAKYKKSNSTTFPKIKLLYFWIALIPLSNIFIDTIKETFTFNSDLMSYSLLKLVLSGIFLLFASISLFLNIRSLFYNNEQNVRNLTGKTNIKEAIKKIFDYLPTSLYFFTGKEIETRIDEYVLEDEPSVKRFNSIFNEFIKDLNGEGLIVVFDNMDRLSNKEKLMSIWSSIHTFFSEIKSDFKVWTMIPYDKNNLSILLQNENQVSLVNEFINKTFFITIRIPNAIYDNWKDYFIELLDYALGVNSLSKNEMDLIINLFSIKNKSKINPRLIVSFINDLVTLKLLKDDINVDYIALYSLEKDVIVKNYSVMINFQQLEKYLPFYNDKEELTKCLAAIFYNVDKETAKNILFEQKIDAELKTISGNFVDNIKNESFLNWFQKAISEMDLSEYSFSNLVLIYNEVSTFYPNPNFHHSFSTKILKSIKNSDAYNKIFDKFINDLSEENAYTYFTTLTTNLATEERLADYCKLMDRLFEYNVHENIKEKIKIKPFLVSAELFMETFFEYEDSRLQYFTKLRIEVTEEELFGYFFENNNFRTDNISEIEVKVIKYLAEMGKKLPKFKKLVKESLLPNLHTQSEQIIDTTLLINRWLYKENTAINIPNAVNIFARYKALNVFSKEKVDIICALVNHLNTKDIRNNVPEVFTMTDVTEETIKIIQDYIGYTEIIKLHLKYKCAIVKTILCKLIQNNMGKALSLFYVFSNIKSIMDSLEEQYFYRFLDDLNRWKIHMTAKTLENSSSLSDWTLLIAKDNIKKYDSVNFIYKHLHDRLKGLQKEEWVESFNSNNPDFASFKNFYEKELLDFDIFDKKCFYDAINELLIGYIKNDKKIELDFFSRIFEHISKPIMNQIVLDIFQIANSSNPASFSKEKTLFILNSISKFNSKINDYDAIIDNYLIKAVDESSEEFNELLANAEIYKCISKIVENYKQDKSFLIDSLDNAKKHENIKKFISTNKLEKINEKEEQLNKL